MRPATDILGEGDACRERVPYFATSANSPHLPRWQTSTGFYFCERDTKLDIEINLRRSGLINSRATGGAGVWGMRLGRVPRPSRHAEQRFKVAGPIRTQPPGPGSAEHGRCRQVSRWRCSDATDEPPRSLPIG